MTETKIRTDTTDALTTRVHHHAYNKDHATIRAGGAVMTCCGFRKTPAKDAPSLPCCPMCRAVLDSHGVRCLSEPA